MGNPYGYPGLGPYRRNARPSDAGDGPRRTRFERADVLGLLPAPSNTAITAQQLALVVFTHVPAARALLIEEETASVLLAIVFDQQRYSSDEIHGQLEDLVGVVELPMGIRMAITRAA